MTPAWEQLIAVFSRNELPVADGMNIFVQQFQQKLQLKHKEEKILIVPLEYQIAYLYPYVLDELRDTYKSKCNKNCNKPSVLRRKWKR